MAIPLITCRTPAQISLEIWLHTLFWESKYVERRKDEGYKISDSELNKVSSII